MGNVLVLNARAFMINSFSIQCSLVSFLPWDGTKSIQLFLCLWFLVALWVPVPLVPVGSLLPMCRVAYVSCCLWFLLPLHLNLNLNLNLNLCPVAFVSRCPWFLLPFIFGFVGTVRVATNSAVKLAVWWSQAHKPHFQNNMNLGQLNSQCDLLCLRCWTIIAGVRGGKLIISNY